MEKRKHNQRNVKLSAEDLIKLEKALSYFDYLLISFNDDGQLCIKRLGTECQTQSSGWVDIAEIISDVTANSARDAVIRSVNKFEKVHLVAINGAENRIIDAIKYYCDKGDKPEDSEHNQEIGRAVANFLCSEQGKSLLKDIAGSMAETYFRSSIKNVISKDARDRISE